MRPRKYEHLVGQDEWGKLTFEQDTRMLNGSIIPVKFRYDHELKIIH